MEFQHAGVRMMQLSLGTQRLSPFTEVVYRRGPRRWLGLRKGHYVRIERPAPWLLGIPLPPIPSLTNLALGAPYPAVITLGFFCMRRHHPRFMSSLFLLQQGKTLKDVGPCSMPHSYQRCTSATCIGRPPLIIIAAVLTGYRHRRADVLPQGDLMVYGNKG